MQSAGTRSSRRGYDERLFFCQEELDLSYRMLNLGYRIEYFPAVKVRHKVSPDHRVAWERGRYFFTVRNALYMSYKFGVPLPRLAVGAAAFLARGAFNGVAGSALRGIGAAIRLCAAYAQSSEDKSLYRLSPEAKRYIEACEPWRQDRMVAKIGRQFGIGCRIAPKSAAANRRPTLSISEPLRRRPVLDGEGTPWQSLKNPSRSMGKRLHGPR